MTNPDVDEVVSPPTKSTLYKSHANLIPLYNYTFCDKIFFANLNIKSVSEKINK